MQYDPVLPYEAAAVKNENTTIQEYSMKKQLTSQASKKSGFTLIELSIVLVIIGLIVGGVLVGQDLIKAAEVRATVGQYEKTNAAINTFRTKYNGIPGDLAEAQAGAFGLFDTGMTGATGLGDGNGLIQGDGGAADQAGEPLVFWRHLSDASLVDGNYGSALASGGLAGANVTAASAPTYAPAAKIGRGNIWLAGAASGLNYYLLSGVTAITAATGALTTAAQLTPIEAFNIDVKVDDGAPNTGTVQARGTDTDEGLFLTLAVGNGGVISAAGAEVAGDCLLGDGGVTDLTNTYSRGSVAGNSPGCMLRMRFN